MADEEKPGVPECPSCHAKNAFETVGGILSCKYCGMRFLPDIYDKTLRGEIAKYTDEKAGQPTEEEQKEITRLRSTVWDLTCILWVGVGSGGAGYLIRHGFHVESVWLSTVILIWVMFAGLLAYHRPDGYSGGFFAKQSRTAAAVLLAVCGSLAALAAGWLMLLMMGVPVLPSLPERPAQTEPVQQTAVTQQTELTQQTGIIQQTVLTQQTAVTQQTGIIQQTQPTGAAVP